MNKPATHNHLKHLVRVRTFGVPCLRLEFQTILLDPSAITHVTSGRSDKIYHDSNTTCATVSPHDYVCITGRDFVFDVLNDDFRDAFGCAPPQR